MAGSSSRRRSSVKVSEPAETAAGVTGVRKGIGPVLDDVGAWRGLRLLNDLNQRKGFDCPGCAWPEPHHTSAAEFCENGAKAVAEEATRERVDSKFFARHSIEALRLRDDHWLGRQGRLTQPMHRLPGATHYEPIEWDDAFAIIAQHLRATEPNRAVFYTSGRTSNEAAFLYQLFVRAYGTNNLPDCSNMCHESSGSALGQTIGVGKGSVTLADFDEAELILVVGQNPGTNHPRMLGSLERAKRRGATIVAINPLPEAGLKRFKNPQRIRGVLGKGTRLADHFLQVRVGGDQALFQLVNAGLVERGAVDRAFVDDHCDGFEELAAALSAVERDALLATAGLEEEQVELLTDLVATSERIITCWAMGLTQHRHAVATIREVVNTNLLRGAIGKPGAGLCPVRGHSNVQGDRTMGIWEKPTDAFLDALEAEFDVAMPREHGLDTVAAIGAMQRGEVDVFMAVGGNFVSAAPDTVPTAAAMRRVGLTVQLSTKLNRSHARCGEEALILPCLGRTERDKVGAVTVEDSMGEVHATRGSIKPASKHLRSEVAIVCGVARATLPDSPLPWEEFATDYARIRSSIERVVPGFEDFEERIAKGRRLQLPHPPRDAREFPTPNGRAQLTVNPVLPIEIPDGRLLLQTLRSHDQYNTTIYGLDDRYRGIEGGRRVVFCHADDLAELGFEDGEVVDVVSEFNDGDRRATAFRLVAYPIARRTAAAYFPEANALVPLGSVAETSNTPTSKAIIVRLEHRP
ncbi:MAG: FdhF/YdeP family oxidoreductase [Nitriliruptorales bacterium]|nr:FdhF/YdeP family oxidoreductase [Nitriliruptorales bacterium]